MKPILEIKGLSKKFILQHGGEPYLSLRDSIKNMFSFRKSNTETFWALNNVSFDVNQGDTIGIIGRNGAGKSTLLKVLSKITPPSEGKIITRGRIASLLEVGTGFHPELTGRENIFFNGAILGMKRSEIISKFDEIVDFSGIEKFIDTPLKRYSSGMQLRLAFSVAAHLNPEVLVIDEVLAVGDVEFQKKCIGKMGDVSRSGRTILFVSHNMAMIEDLCAKSILLSNGKIVAEGPSREITQKYITLNAEDKKGENGLLIVEKHDRVKNIMNKVEILIDGRTSSIGYMGCHMELRAYFDSEMPLDFPVLGIIVKDVNNIPVLGINNKAYSGNIVKTAVHRGYFSMEIPYLQLMSGIYSLDVRLGNGYKDIHIMPDCMTLNVEAFQFSEEGVLPPEKLNKFFMKDVRWKVSGA